MKTKLYIEILILIILGAVTSLSLPPLNFFIVNFFTFTSFYLFLTKKSEQHKNFFIFFLYGWSFGFGYFVTNLYWISISLTFDQNYKFLIPLTVFLIPAFLAIFYGFVSCLFRIFKPRSKAVSFLIFSLIFGAIEFARGSILTGFPWNLIAYSFSNFLEFISIISILGTYAFNLFCISLFTMPSIFLTSHKNKKNLSIGVLTLTLALSFYVYGVLYKDKFDKIAAKTNEFKIRIIGSNISLDRFYLDIDPASVIKELINVSNPNDKEKMIFVWPEGILPKISQDELVEYSFLFDNRFNENHLLIIGTNNYLDNNGKRKYFNTLSIYDNKLRVLNTYNKINLVPFGEFLPFENLLRKFGLKSLTNNYHSFTKGSKRDIIEISKDNFSFKILPLICYEIIYSGKLFNNSDFDLIINLSEDGWFGKSLGPKQHFDHSIFRAIESGKYIIRSSNNGIAGIINPLGFVEQKVNFGKSGYIDFKAMKKIQPTIFSLYGNKIFLLVILLYIVMIFLFNKIKDE